MIDMVSIGVRRPYILFGGIVALFLLAVMGWAQSYIMLLLAYCLFQIAMNSAYVAYQAFIPDMVDSKRRGMASGTKGLMEMLGIVVFIYPVSILMDRYFSNGDRIWIGGSLGILALVLLVTLLLTLILVREKPSGFHELNSLKKTLINTFKIDTSKNRSFIWFLISRMLVFIAFTTLQQFSFNFLTDVTGVTNPAEATAQFSIIGVIGILVIIWPAGRITDRIGRKPVTITACFIGTIGITLILFSHDLSTILVASGFIGLAVGSFYSANWALATDLVPKNQEAHYLGLVNIATAGGAVIARLIGPVIDILNSHYAGWGYRAMLLSCVVYLIAGSLLILKVNKK
ncbi:MAG: MFS transporter [Dehalococcoidia bacterium]|nr:MAG: MFS transporter [Dehalococcoidia bacterium]